MHEMLNVRVATNGRMVLPRSARNALGVAGSGVVVLSVNGDEVRLSSMRQSINRAQELYRAHVTNDLSSAAFLDERRVEAERDLVGDGQN